MGWLGGGILTTFVLGPNLMKLAPPSRLEFNAKVLPRILRFVQIALGTTLLFGILLLYEYFNGDFSSLFKTGQGMELSAGVILALVVVAVAMGVTFPSFRKVIQMSNSVIQGGQQAPPPDMMKYGRRARIGSLIGVVLLLVVLAMMVSAGFGFF